MIEVLETDAWLYGLLAGDAALAAEVDGRIYDTQPPQGAATPFVVFQNLSAVDVLALARRRVLVNALYQVKLVAEARSWLPLRPGAERLDVVLHGASGTTVGAVVVSCARESVIRYVEVPGGVEYRHLGGLFRLWAHALP